MHVSPSIFGVFEKSYPTTPSTLPKIQWANLKKLSTEKSAPPFCQFFGLVPTQKIFIFYLHLGIQPSKTGEKLVYYHLYYEEASFYLYVFIRGRIELGPKKSTPNSVFKVTIYDQTFLTKKIRARPTSKFWSKTPRFSPKPPKTVKKSF